MSEAERDFFGDRVATYDDFIPRVVPHYHEVNRLLTTLVPFDREARLSAVDIGAGTGAVSGLLLERFPSLTLLAVDMSAAMLARCAARLAPFGARAVLRQGAFPEVDIGGGHDLVVSSLALHHLSHADKRLGFAAILAALRPGGAFLLRDVVAAATPALEPRYAVLYRESIAAQGFDDLDWLDEHAEDDNPAPVPDLLAWLAEAGFENVACHWQHLNIALIGGDKPGSG